MSDFEESPLSSDRTLVRPYVPESVPDRPYQDDPASTGPVFVPDPTPMTLPGDSDREPPVSHVNPESDRRQMVWLIGSGLALVIAVAVTMFALWPSADEETPSAGAPRPAAPPAAGPSDAPQGSAPANAPSKGAATPSGTGTGTRSGTSATTAPAAPGTNAPNFPLPPAGNGTNPPGPSTPPATLAPPPAQNRTGPVVAASGNCLDIDSNLLILGNELVTRDCDNTSTQRFTLASDGTLKVGGSCAVQDGSSVELGVCNRKDAGQWRAGPGNTLVNDGSKLCLAANDNAVSVATCGGADQAWKLP